MRISIRGDYLDVDPGLPGQPCRSWTDTEGIDYGRRLHRQAKRSLANACDLTSLSCIGVECAVPPRTALRLASQILAAACELTEQDCPALEAGESLDCQGMPDGECVRPTVLIAS